MKSKSIFGRISRPELSETKKLLFLIIPIVTGLSMMSCTNNKATASTEDESGKSYPVIVLETKDTVLELQYVADVQAKKNIELRTRVEGILEKIHVDEGQPVRKGQLLFKINDEEFRMLLIKAEAAYESAVADAKVAEVEVERVKKLVAKNIISNTELELAEAKYNALKAMVAQAKAARLSAARRLSYSNIYAPFDGVIDRLPLREGSLLEEGSLLTTISDIESMYAYFNLSEAEYFQLIQAEEMDGRKNAARLVLADGTVYPWPGEVSPAESEIDEQTGSIAFRAHFPNPQKLLKHGATGKLIITKTINNALLVPQKAVFEIQDRNYVFVVDETNTVRMKAFVPADRIDRYYVVKSGLTPNEKIVYEGVQILRDGQTIQPELITKDQSGDQGKRDRAL